MTKPHLLLVKVCAIMATVILLAVAIYSNRNQMMKAFEIIFQKDAIKWFILFLILPIQLLNSFIRGNINNLFLRTKGDDISRTRMTRIAIETNLVDHIAIFSGVAGMAFFVWRLSSNKIKASSAAYAQIVSYFLIFVSTVLLLIVSVIYLVISNGNETIVINGTILAALITSVLIILFIMIWHFNFFVLVAKVVNTIIAYLTFGKKNNVINISSLQSFLRSIKKTFTEITTSKKALFKPFCWSLLASVMDASLIFITFASLGIWINPAILFVASSWASNACIIFPTPGGIGTYEGSMILLLIAAGISADSSIAGILLARTILFIIYIAFGLPFLLMTIRKYGRPPTKEKN